MDKCAKCNMPLEAEEHKCACNDSLCVHCCDCGPDCGCECVQKK